MTSDHWNSDRLRTAKASMLSRLVDRAEEEDQSAGAAFEEHQGLGSDDAARVFTVIELFAFANRTLPFLLALWFFLHLISHRAQEAGRRESSTQEPTNG